MNLANGETLLTVRDIAARIAFDKSEHGIARTMRQVRHWTQSDLLRTVSEKHTGTGIPRVYQEEPTLVIAAMLLEVSRYGATVDVLKPFADALYEDYEEYGLNYLIAMTDEGEAFVEVSWKVDPESGRFTDARVYFFREDPRMGEIVEMDPEPYSSIVIRMNRVMDRIFPPPSKE